MQILSYKADFKQPTKQWQRKKSKHHKSLHLKPKRKVREFFVFYFCGGKCSSFLFIFLKTALLCHVGFSWSLPAEYWLYVTREHERACVVWLTHKNRQCFFFPLIHRRLSNHPDKWDMTAGLSLCCCAIVDLNSSTWTSVLTLLTFRWQKGI